jgi:hypothetical protein
LARDYEADLVVLHVAQLPLLMSMNGELIPTPVDEAESARGKMEQVRPADPRVGVFHQLAERNPAEEDSPLHTSRHKWKRCCVAV